MSGVRFTPYLLALALTTAACGRGVDTIELFYNDELVEAPTRTFGLRVLQTSADCEDVLSHLHGEPVEGEELVMEKSGRYPLNPELALLEGAPHGVRLVLDFAAFDESEIQISRACQVVNLSSSAASNLRIELRALPKCESFPRALDVMIALDTSFSMNVSDSELTHLTALVNNILSENALPTSTTYGLITFGHTQKADELVEYTSDVQVVKDKIEEVRTIYQHKVLLFDGITKAAQILRARAVCGRKSVIVLTASNGDEGSRAKFEDAQIGLFAGRGDPDDDLFVFAITTTEPGFNVLDALIPQDVGIVTGTTPSLADFTMVGVREGLNGLLVPPPPPEEDPGM